MRDPYAILVKPMVSEKSVMLIEENKYSFVVAREANKIEIKQAVEQLFKVKVLSVTTRNLRGKVKTMGRYRGRRPDTKRAIVTLAEGNKIEIFSNLQ